MFRVPSNADQPTFDDVFEVSFWRWLTSKGPERNEWMRRRNAAAQVARRNQDARVDAWAEEKRRKHEGR